jgi:hypothetical protein
MQHALALLLCVAGFLAYQEETVGRLEWAEGYPKAGAKAGEILLAGKIRLDPGHTLVSARLEYHINGCVVMETMLRRRNDNTFEQTLTGLTPGVEYAVHVIVVQRRGSEESTLALVGILNAP